MCLKYRLYAFPIHARLPFPFNSGNHMFKQILTQLETNHCQNTHLDLSGKKLDDDAIAALVSAVKKNTFVQSINLTRNAIQDRGALLCLELIDTHPTLKKIYFDYNAIGYIGSEALCSRNLQKSKHPHLDLSHRHLSTRRMTRLVWALQKNGYIQSLDLSHTRIQLKSARLLTQLLKIHPTRLQQICVASAHIGNWGASMLAEGLYHNRGLRVLDISNNEIGDQGAQALAEAIRANTTLECLNIAQNPIGIKATKSLILAFSSNTREIDLELHSKHKTPKERAQVSRNLKASLPSDTPIKISFCMESESDTESSESDTRTKASSSDSAKTSSDEKAFPIQKPEKPIQFSKVHTRAKQEIESYLEKPPVTRPGCSYAFRTKKFSQP